LLTGLVVWKWFDASVRSAAMVLPENRGLMQQVYLPKLLLPLSVVVTNTMKFAITFSLLIVFLLWQGMPLMSDALLFLPLLWFSQLVLTVGTACLAAALVPLMPDLRYVVNYGLIMLFFMSGIFFSLSELAPEAQALLAINPLLQLIDGYRAVLLDAQPPPVDAVLVVLLTATAVCAMAFWLMRRFDRVYPRLV
ncbi:MAG: ABC transporter permease, partial [Pseudomonadota bacterium]